MNTWQDLRVASCDEVLHWAALQHWGRAMASCQQDAGWHAEGDVWTHTTLVVRELERLAVWPSLTIDDRFRLLMTAIFHDSGKPETSALDPESGRIRSPKHSLVGEKRARSLLRDLGCPVMMREEIARLVRYHGRPPYLFEKADVDREVIGLSWLVDTRLLYHFTLADTRGRSTAEMGRSVDVLDLWRLAAEDNACFGRPYAFANDHARFLFYRNELSSLHYVPRQEPRCRVIVLSGLPGAGKDTWLSRHHPDLPVVSLDEVRNDLDVDATDDQGAVIQKAREECREHLRAGRDFSLNATNTMKLTRRRWIDLFADYQARIEIAYIEPDLATIRAHNRRRQRRVPDDVIDRLVEKLDPPTVTEAHDLMLVE